MRDLWGCCRLKNGCLAGVCCRGSPPICMSTAVGCVCLPAVCKLRACGTGQHLHQVKAPTLAQLRPKPVVSQFFDFKGNPVNRPLLHLVFLQANRIFDNISDQLGYPNQGHDGPRPDFQLHVLPCCRRTASSTARPTSRARRRGRRTVARASCLMTARTTLPRHLCNDRAEQRWATACAQRLAQSRQ